MGFDGRVDPAPRLEILALLPEPPGKITTAAIGKATKKHPGTIDQMLNALRVDGLVDFEMMETSRGWWRTHLPIPEKFTSTAAVKYPGVYDDRALRQALRIPLMPPPLPGPRITHRQR